ncbi:Multidrug resistance-associated protein 1 [Geodia barretti]|nr:Multidrug resistance-associated protein 1 [Geodia barretti]
MLVVLVSAFCDLFYTVYQQSVRQVAEYQYVTPIVLSLTMGLMIGVVTTHRVSGIKSSGLPFVFWLVMMFYAALKMRTLVLVAEDKGSVKDVFRFTTFCVQFASYVGLFVLTLLPEHHSRRHSYTLLHDGIDQRKPCPELEATFLSRITWWWLNGLIWDGWRKPLLYSDLTDLNEEDKAKRLGPRFQRNWDKELKKSDVKFTRVPVKPMEYQPVNVEILPTSGEPGLAPEPAQGHGGRGPSLVLALARSFGGTFFIAGFFKLGQDLLGFASPQILKLMIRFTEDPSESDWRGYLYAVLLFVTAVVQSLLLHQYFHRCFLVGMRVRTAVISAIYNKALRLSNSARRERTVGEIVNLMSVDAQRFMDLMSYLHMIWSAPLQIVLALIFLYITMGFSIFAGFAVMVLLIPINAVIAAKSRTLQVKQMILKDSRIKLVNEVLNGMKVIKLYAWEIPFKQQIMGIRQGELNVLRSTAFLNAGSSFTWTCAPFLVALATFATFVLVNKDSSNPNDRLTADKAFVALSLFNILRFPLSMLPMLISFMVESSVSVKRLREFLKGNEIDPNNVERSEEPATEGENVIAVSSGEFTWDTGDKSTLEDINIQVKRGQLVGVVGLVGAGKSSLIQAILGEMEKVGGTVEVKGRVAYVPQQAWIQNATVRENIEFGQAHNEAFYKRTLEDCALEQDLEILPGGDMTEIGEKGINLSGGQKQRVSLARAVYQEADVYLLDDPLSAVDSHVGETHL